MAAQTVRGIPLSAVSPRYLHTNSTSHTGPFSAIAELIDNAYDPDVSAKEFWIDKTTVKDQDCLTFTDNGNGMDYDKMHKMLSFGFSDKHTVRGHVPVGLYGNGFKSGSMRLGKDAIVFSKKADTMCVGLLSQTYLEKINAENVIVPIVVFTKTGQTDVAQEYEECLHDIQTNSLFNTKEELLSELSAINGPYGTNSTGTRIIIWNLRRTTTKELEFDFTKDRYDIHIPVDINESTKEPNKEPENGTATPSQYSLRAYSSILYLKPRMQIIIRGQKVKTQLISKSLALVIKDTYKPTFLKRGIKIIFGYNTKNKEHYGLMMYHKNRLIKAYERVACQRKANRTGVGVIGVIECNYLTPMHNKQDFENTEEYRKTIHNVSNKLEEYWKEIRHRRQNCSVPAEDDVKRPDQNWVQCDKCLKWRKLPDGIDTELLPDKWYCHLNPDPQFRTCTVEEEPQDSDDEQPRYQKTYKQHERNQKLQKEKDRQQMEQEQKKAEISALAKEKADLLKKNQDLMHQLQRGSPARGTLGSPCSSSPHNHSGLRSPDNIPVISHVKSLAPVPTRKRRATGPSRENSELKRARLIDHFNSNTPVSPSTSTASPEVCSSSVTGSGDGDGDQTTWKDDDDDDILIIEDISSPRPKSATGTFDLNKVKSECIVSEEELGNPMERGDGDTVVSMETTAAASPPALLPVSPRDVSIGTQTPQIPAVKQEEGYAERRKKENWSDDGVNHSNHFESEKDFPSVARNTNKELKSINKETRDQQNSVPSVQEENQERNKTKVTVNSEEELNNGDVSDEISPGGQTSTNLENSVLDVSEAQQQQDKLLELLEVVAKERDESRSKLLLLSSQMDDLRSELLELRQSTLKKEHGHKSTQTIPEEAADYRELYLRGKEEIKRLQDELTELKMEKEKGRERKGQEASLEYDDEVAGQIDCLLRELDQRNKERDELKEEVDGLVNEKCTLLTCCERLQKDLEEKKRESENVKVKAEDQEVQTDFPVSSREESAATSADASNSGQTRETQDGPEIKQENNSTQLYSLRLRELRQRVARLLVTFVPALDLQQVNYDCEVIDEILTQVVDEITPTEAAST